MPTIEIVVPNLIHGELRPAQTDQFEDVFNPSTGQVIAHVFLSSRDDARKRRGGCERRTPTMEPHADRRAAPA